MDNAKLVVDGDKWGRNLLLNSGEPSPITMRSNNSTTFPLETGVEDGVNWMRGVRVADNTFHINSYVQETFSSNYGTRYSNELENYDGPVTCSVEVMSEYPLDVSIGQGTRVLLEPNVWTRISRTEVKGTRPNGLYALNNPEAPLGTKLYWRRYKIEKGSTATPWTPAPEDFNNVATWNDLMKSKVFDLSMPLEVGEYYTLSINDVPSSYFQLWSDNETFVADLVNGVITFKVIEDGVNSIVLKSHNMDELQWVKLEKGKKATDWIPTPEDIYDKADKTVVDDLVQEVDRLETVTATKEELGEVLASLNEYRRVLESSEVDLQTAKEEISTLLSRVPAIENNLGEFVEHWKFLDTYARLGEEGFIIGSETGATAIRITDDRIDFLDGSGEPVAYITNQIMRINRGIFVDSAQIGEHKIETIENGHTIFTWMG